MLIFEYNVTYFYMEKVAIIVHQDNNVGQI
jgi:hypothetical protein